MGQNAISHMTKGFLIFNERHQPSVVRDFHRVSQDEIGYKTESAWFDT